MFAGNAESSAYYPNRIENIRPFHDKWFGTISDEEKAIMKGILIQLFPKLEAVFNDHFYGSDYLSIWRRKLRICSPEIFPIYFRLALPEGQISNIEMSSILAMLGDRSVFEEKMMLLSKQIKSDGSSRLRDLLERIQDYTEKDIPIKHVPIILKSLFNVGDNFLSESDKGRGPFGIGNDILMGQIVIQLLKRFSNQEDRYRLLKEALSEGEAAEMAVHEVEILGQQQGKYKSPKRPEPEWFVTSEQLSELEKIALEKIRKAAFKGELLYKSGAVQMLFRWRDWENAEAVKEYLKGIIVTDEDLAEFLSRFLVQSSSWGMGDKLPRFRWRIDPRTINKLAGDVEDIATRSRKILNENPFWLEGSKKIALETFLNSYDLLSKGKDIDYDEE